MNNHETVYFIKFGLEDIYVDLLVKQGEMLMKCGKYYEYLGRLTKDDTIGDTNECRALGMISAWDRNPIYCFYTVSKGDIVKHHGDVMVKIEKKVIDSFCPEGKRTYAVFEANKLIEKITNTEIARKAGLTFKSVFYGKLSVESSLEVLFEQEPEIAFIKSPKYSYQNEARILLMGEEFGPIGLSKDSTIIEFSSKDEKGFHPFRGKKYWFGSFEDITSILSCDDLILSDEYYYLPLSKINIGGGLHA